MTEPLDPPPETLPPDTQTAQATPPDAPPPLRVAAPWMDERSHSMLRDFFRVGLKSRCVLVENERAQAIVVDLDRGDVTARLAEARERWPDAPLIELSINHTDEALFVRKPLRPAGVARAVQSVRRRLHLPDDSQADALAARGRPPPERVQRTPPDARFDRDFTGTAGDVDPDDAGTWARASYRPETFLQGIVQGAAKQADTRGQAMALSGVWGRWIIPPGNGLVHIDMADTHLRSLCVVEVNAAEVRIDPVPADADPTCPPRAVTRNALLWKMALWSARGRVPEGVVLDAPVYLQHLPDLTTLVAPPHALRIAALWLNHPISLLALSERLGLPQRYVFAFYSACAAIGLAGPARRDADTLVDAPEISAAGMGSLLTRLRARLTRPLGSGTAA